MAISCAQNKKNENNTNLKSNAGEQSSGKLLNNTNLNPNAGEQGSGKLLNSSQLSQVKDSFEFLLTKEGKKLSLNELLEIAKELKSSIYPKRKIESKDKKYYFDKLSGNEKFKKYFVFKSALNKGFSFLSGHKMEFEFFVDKGDKKIPSIEYVLRCPDRITNGIWNAEDRQIIYLDISHLN